jgi:hypothetical protein
MAAKCIVVCGVHWLASFLVLALMVRGDVLARGGLSVGLALVLSAAVGIAVAGSLAQAALRLGAASRPAQRPAPVHVLQPVPARVRPRRP